MKLQWQFDRPAYAPGTRATVSLVAHNEDPWPYWVQEWALTFDFGHYLFPCQRLVPPRQGVSLGQGMLQFPPSVAGTRHFYVSVRAHAAPGSSTQPPIEWRTDSVYSSGGMMGR